MSSPLPLDAQGLRKTYGSGDTAVTALDGVDCQVQAGGFVAIMGASGSGKSTLLHLVTGLADTDAGTVAIAGTDLASLNDTALTELRRRELGIVFQAYNLVPVLNALENVALPLLLDGLSKAEAEAKALEQLTAVGLANRSTHRPDQCSGGEQQRIAIARALVSQPAIIVADEPTGNLDSTATERIGSLLKELNAAGTAILMVTHEASVAHWAKEVVVLADGRMADRFATSDCTSVADLAARYQAASAESPA